MPSLVEIGSVVLENIFKVSKFRYYRSMEKERGPLIERVLYRRQATHHTGK